MKPALVECSAMPTDDSHLDHSRMSLGDHLDQMRYRLILSLVGVAAAAGVALMFGKQLIAWLCIPLTDAQRAANIPAQTYVLSPMAGFSIYLKVSMITGIIMALPWVLYQGWRFFEPGLYARERRAVLVLTPFSAVMTALGVAFTYYIMLPTCLWFLISFSTSFPMPGGTDPSPTPMGRQAQLDADTKPSIEQIENDPLQIVTVPVLTKSPAAPVEGQVWIKADQRVLNIHIDGDTRSVPLKTATLVSPLIEVGSYINFVAVMVLGLVVAFQLPVAMLIMGSWSLVDPALLARYRGHCVLACFAAGALLTPSDVLSMMLLAVPLWGLFEFGLMLMRLTYRRRHSAS